jgi:hypothetical protein
MKKKIISAVILLILGIAVIAAGRFYRPLTRSADVTAFTDASIGTTVNIITDKNYYYPIDEFNWTYYPVSDIIVCVTIPEDLCNEVNYQFIDQYRMTLTGTVEAATDEMKENAYQAFIDHYIMLEEYNPAFALSDEEKGYLRDSISDYCIRITSTDLKTVQLIRTSAYIAGAIFILSFVILLISAISKKSALKISLVFAGIIVLLAAVAAVVFHKHLCIMAGIRKDGKGVYYMEYNKELKIDELLAAGITSDEELIKWFGKAEYHGISPVTLDPTRYGCSSFAARTSDGDILFGRNFDYPETDTVIIYTDPENGYASYAVADLAVMGIGYGAGMVSPDSHLGRFMMTATPYVVCDGVNEAGLGISTLELDIGEIHQDAGRPDLFVYNAVRVILDRCATVDEAIDLLNAYDIHTHNDVSQHLFIADKSGRSVVIEWFDDKMYVNELDAVTNSVLTPGDHYGEEADWRLDVLIEGLETNGGILTNEQARDLLEDVSQIMTEWSAVYNLNDFNADIYMDRNYAHAYHYGS